MWLPSFLVSLAVLSVAAVKIPIEDTDNTPKSSDSAPLREVPIIDEQLQVKPIYYATDEVNVDSYLVPPNPHKPEEALHDVLVTPATFLLPPALDMQSEYYYKPTEPGEQSDWYPIAAAPQKQIEIIPIIQNERQESQIVNGNYRTGKVLQSKEVPVPSRDLLPPREDAPNDFIILSPSVELELPSEEIDHTLINYENTDINPSLVSRLIYEKQYPRKLRIKPDIPVPYITPPKDLLQTYKNPTLLYPKKFHSEFRPVPIPISQINEGDEAPIVKGPSPLKSVSNNDNEYSVPVDEKKKYLSEKAERKRKLKEQHEAAQLAAATGEPNKENPLEQETSETHYREPGRDAYPSKRAPLAPLKQPVMKSNGERTEFRMHGMKGPHSYQFGYDTGKGKNRQFRYEERDNDGHVRGHYGYVDKFGKLRVVNYDADPEHGFRAEEPVEKE